MAAGSIEELLDLLYIEIEEAKNAPLSNDRCVVDRDRVLDMIDDVKAEMPVEIKRAKDIVAQRNDYMADAKQKADRLRQEAEDYAKELLNKDAITRGAEQKAADMIAEAEVQCQQLKEAASEYCEETLRRMEEAVADAYDEVPLGSERPDRHQAHGFVLQQPPPAGPQTRHVRRRGRRGRISEHTTRQKAARMGRFF